MSVEEKKQIQPEKIKTQTADRGKIKIRRSGEL
jgi:hypothetical protein